MEGGKYLKRLAIRTGKSLLKNLLRATAPMWVPLLIMLGLAYSTYLILFELPRQALADTTASKLTKVQAFLGITEDRDAMFVDEELLERYKRIADRWDEGLSDDQKRQVQRFKFPYTLLMAVDRVVHDNAVWEGKKNVEPQPEKVFEALRPRFQWKNSTVTTVTHSVDENGNPVTHTSVENVLLVTRADTYEGTYLFEYEWVTTTSGNTTVTREVLKNVIPPDVLYVPLKNYLRETRGIMDEDTFELVQQLTIHYAPEEELQIYDPDINLDDLREYPPGNANIPYYSQADKRWATLPYGRTGTIYSSGCGPTCLAMVISGLTGKTVTPDVVAAWSVKNGYRIEGAGSAWALMTAGGAHWGLKVQPISRKDGASIVKALSEGRPVIASMGKGHFTNGGHFIVLRGISDRGKILVYDPISVSRSQQEWDLELILRESSTNGGVNGSPFWAFSI